MKKVICNLFVLVMLFHLSCMKNEKIISSDQGVTAPRTIYENTAFPDAYPEWGSIGQNGPAPSITQTYSPDPQNILRFQISNPAAYHPNGLPSPYFHLQYRKLNNSGGVVSGWYNYHPTLQGYDKLRIDTLTYFYHPMYGSWDFSVNPKIFPRGKLQFRTRLLYPHFSSPALDTSQKGCASLWSTDSPVVDNSYGDMYWGQDHEPTEGDIVTASVHINLTLDIWNTSATQIGLVKITAFGQTTTQYLSTYPQVSGTLSINATIDTPRTFTYEPTVSLYNSSGNLIATFSNYFTHQIYVNSLMGSNPTFYFNDTFPIQIL